METNEVLLILHKAYNKLAEMTNDEHRYIKEKSPKQAYIITLHVQHSTIHATIFFICIKGFLINVFEQTNLSRHWSLHNSGVCNVTYYIM